MPIFSEEGAHFKPVIVFLGKQAHYRPVRGCIQTFHDSLPEYYMYPREKQDSKSLLCTTGRKKF